MKKTITQKTIDGLKPAPAGTRYEIMDALAPGFGIRVTDKGHATYVLVARLPGSKNPVRRAIGQVGSITLGAARQTARDWKIEILGNVDPQTKIAVAVAAAIKAKGNTFGEVAESYIAAHVASLVGCLEITRAIRREFGGVVDGKPTGPWGNKPITEIETDDCATVTENKAKTAPAHAINLLSLLGRVFDYAIVKGKLKYSPTAAIKSKKLVPYKNKKRPGRKLTDDEMGKIWRGAAAIGYPIGTIYQMLMLTGCRLNEVVDGHRSEIDMRAKTWTIPPNRMKGKIEHVIPLTTAMLKILNAVPRFNEGDFLFSKKNGKSPVYVSTAEKNAIDATSKVFSPWVNHDLRRTMRSHLSKLPIEEHVRELMVAHKRKGIEGVYDMEPYLTEKKAGFELWCAKLASIVDTKRKAA